MHRAAKRGSSRKLGFRCIGFSETQLPLLGVLGSRGVPVCLIHPFIGYATSRAGERVSSKGGEVRWIRDFDSRRPPDRSPGAFYLSRSEPGSFLKGSGPYVIFV